VYSAVTSTSAQHTADDIDCSKTAMSHDDTIISVRLSASLTYDLISETVRNVHTVTIDPNGKSQAPDRSVSVPMTLSDLIDGTRGPSSKTASLRRCQNFSYPLRMSILFERPYRGTGMFTVEQRGQGIRSTNVWGTPSIRPYGSLSWLLGALLYSFLTCLLTYYIPSIRPYDSL